jgi:hypothetical protein
MRGGSSPMDATRNSSRLAVHIVGSGGLQRENTGKDGKTRISGTGTQRCSPLARRVKASGQLFKYLFKYENLRL